MMQNKRPRWSPEELDLLGDRDKTYAELREILPHRTIRSIKKHCQIIGIYRSKESRRKSGQFLSPTECEKILQDEKFTQKVDGCLLGDACIPRPGRALSFCTANKEYLEHLQSYFGKKLKSTARINHNAAKSEMRDDGETWNTHDSYSIRYGRIGIFGHFYKRWYKNGSKRVPNDLRLSPELCLRWYIDDGSMRSTQGMQITLHTDGFLKPEVENLCRKFNGIGIPAKVGLVGYRKDGETKCTIRIFGKDVISFLKYIGPSPVKSYAYKWHLRGYKERSLTCPFCGKKVRCWGFAPRKSCGARKCSDQIYTLDRERKNRQSREAYQLRKDRKIKNGT